MDHYQESSRSPWSMAEVVAQFQPRPIIDLSVPVEAGRVLYLPDPDWIEAVVYGETLTEVPDL